MQDLRNSYGKLICKVDPISGIVSYADNRRKIDFKMSIGSKCSISSNGTNIYIERINQREFKILEN